MFRSLVLLSVCVSLRGAEPNWETVPLLRQPRDNSPYADVAARFPHHQTMRWREYQTSDTTTHEMTHALNGILSFNTTLAAQRKNPKTPRQMVFYVGDGRCFVLPICGVKLAEVVRDYKPIPEFRDSELTYLYKHSQQVKDALDLFDEWIAYMQDARQGLYAVRNLPGHRLNPMVDRLVRFAHLCTAVAMTIEKHNPAFIDDRFKTFFVWCHEESARLVEACRGVKTLYPSDASRVALLCNVDTTPGERWLLEKCQLRYDQLYPNPPHTGASIAQSVPPSAPVPQPVVSPEVGGSDKLEALISRLLSKSRSD